METYLLVDNYDIERLVCEENIVIRGADRDYVVCTEEYYANVIAVKNYLDKEERNNHEI